MWRWDDGDEFEAEEDGEDDVDDGIRMVVFGDSWIDDTPRSGQSGKGKSWARIACEEVLLRPRTHIHLTRVFARASTSLLTPYRSVVHRT
jgi:hypothetical protein